MALTQNKCSNAAIVVHVHVFNGICVTCLLVWLRFSQTLAFTMCAGTPSRATRANRYNHPVTYFSQAVSHTTLSIASQHALNFYGWVAARTWRQESLATSKRSVRTDGVVHQKRTPEHLKKYARKSMWTPRHQRALTPCGLSIGKKSETNTATLLTFFWGDKDSPREEPEEHRDDSLPISAHGAGALLFQILSNMPRAEKLRPRGRTDFTALIIAASKSVIITWVSKHHCDHDELYECALLFLSCVSTAAFLLEILLC